MAGSRGPLEILGAVVPQLGRSVMDTAVRLSSMGSSALGSAAKAATTAPGAATPEWIMEKLAPPAPTQAGGRWAGSPIKMVPAPSPQSCIDAANDVFASLSLQLWIVQPTSANARPRVNVTQAEGSRSSGEVHTLTPREFVQFMRDARDSMEASAGHTLDAYVDRLAAAGRLQPIPLVPARFLHKLYVDIARVMVFSFQRAVLTLDQGSLWGHTLKVESKPSLRNHGNWEHNQVGIEQLTVIVDKMLESYAVHMSMLPRPLERRLYINCLVVVFQLFGDLLTNQGKGEISFLGHRLHFHLEPQPLDIVHQIIEEFPVTHCRINEDSINELVDELLADDSMNSWVPDVIERQMYKSAMRLLIRVAEDVICRLQLRMLGREIHCSLVSQKDQRANQDSASSKSSLALLCYEEEDPLNIASTTELQMRLKDIHAQQRVVKALQDLGGASFDFTAERPMVQRGKEQPHAAAGAPPGGAPAGGAAVTADVSSFPEVSEFQQLAHTLKLARSLRIQRVVDAEIDVPFNMIADLESYPLWMPWCTSGKAAKESSDALQFEGNVGFGFDTGTFLGHIGDEVFYHVTLEPPLRIGDNNEPVEADTARVLADAVRGFTYGSRLAYDWRFRRITPTRTLVELDLLFQAKSVLYMPIWESMQSMVVKGMFSAFQARAEVLQRQRPEGPGEVRGAAASKIVHNAATSR